jgi:hypothetical protein
VNASIRLLSSSLLGLSFLLSSGCATGTRAGAPPLRLVREPMILDEGAAHAAGSPAQQARAPEHLHSSLSWSVNAAR